MSDQDDLIMTVTVAAKRAEARVAELEAAVRALRDNENAADAGVVGDTFIDDLEALYALVEESKS